MSGTLSVIIPCFNNESYLESCVESIVGDTAVSEIIIVDDASMDRSLEIASSIAARYPTVKVIERVENGGAAAARLDGLMKALGRFVAFVDADDLIDKDACTDALRIISEEQSDICIWTMWRFDADRQWLYPEMVSSEFPKSGRQAAKETLGEWRIHPLGVAKRELYEKAYDGFFENGLNADELITRLVFFNAEKISLSGKAYYYRRNPQSATQKVSAKRLSTLSSSLWLHRFQMNFPELPAGLSAKKGISEAWGFIINREAYGPALVMDHVGRYFEMLNSSTNPRTWLWRYPKHMAAYAVMSLMLWMHRR